MTQRWSIDAISEWYARQAWLCGFNYLPRTAINWIEQWQAESFDPHTIDQELGWAESVGFNTLRTNLHSLIWSDDAPGLRGRIDRFLGIAARHGLRAMVCLFDDCGFSGREPALGPQGAPMPNVHNSGACASPGRAVVRSGNWGALQRYVSDIVGHFRDDARILAWDLYNEPGNDSVFVPQAGGASPDPLLPHSLALTRATVAWARASQPKQPLTIGIWNPGWPEENAALLELCDFVSFHNYAALPLVTAQVEHLRTLGRPIVCTEWLARGLNSRPRTHLPYFRAERIGCYHWGLVNGRTQTHLPWPGFGQPGDETWHHDLFHPDGRPYDADEVATFRAMLRPKTTSAK